METKTFAELGLSQKVQAAITAAGYANPTPIQAAAIPVAVTGRDVLGIAQTGTGKTASFALPMITRLETGRARARMPRSLILAPTRELAAQCAQSFEKYGVNHKLDVALLIGGVSMDDQVKKLDRGVDVLIATPGRLLDHFGRGRIMLMGVEILVIDEADRMLDMGFIPDIEKICKLLPPRRQTLFFSATMPPEITRLVNQFLHDPERIEVAKPATTAKTITQSFRFCPDSEDWVKREMLRDMIRADNVRNAIIFCNRKRDVAILLKSLLKHGFNAGALHGDMDQTSRMETLDKFRNGDITLLAASDVAARGLDIPDVSHVFNFDLPWQSDDYVHRIGRTGRAGKQGIAQSIVTHDELKSLKDIEKMLGEDVVWIGTPPTEQDFADAGKRRRGRGRGGKPGASRDGGRRDGARGEGRRASGGGRGERPAAAPAASQPASERTATRKDRAPREEARSEPPREGARPQQVAKPPKPVAAAKREDRPAAPPPAPRTRAPRPQEPESTKAAVGAFAGNVPAFLRRSSRPAKAAGE
ncbi:MAG: DEAD/DEAH box helicase [Rhizobiales bacterium]|nr:DEAD/DEAH box helicase [Hyphomicrobiales bacterium]